MANILVDKVFTKLASQLNPSKLAELGVIPVIFLIQLAVSYLVSIGVSRCFRLNRRATNFVTAMGVFGNSNSLPISLIISLSQTLKGLHWDKVPGDNDDDVAARGILYLLIFQQLGQLVRWSWGYHVLLAPKHKYEEYRDGLAEEGRPFIQDSDSDGDSDGLSRHIADEEAAFKSEGRHHYRTGTGSDNSARYEPAGRTPVPSTSAATPNDSDNDDEEDEGEESEQVGPKKPERKPRLSTHGNAKAYQPEDLNDALDGIRSFPPIPSDTDVDTPSGIKGLGARTRRFARKKSTKITSYFVAQGRRAYSALPRPLRRTLSVLYRVTRRVYAFVWEFMNPPLWAMLIALVVASFPALQKLFFQDGSFVKSSVTTAIGQSAGVAVPLILVVLGANLARNTQTHESVDPEEKEIGTRLLVASLVSRMLLPTLIMAPVLAVFAKYVPISILDDPIFIIVCFLLTGAPSALQLAQICQINGVYENKMSQILFQGYVVW